MAKEVTALDGARIRATREVKGFRTQDALAKVIGVPQPHICDLEKGKLRNAEVFVRVADVLECTTDFLFRRGQFALADSAEEVRRAVSQMAFDVFAKRPDVTEQRLEWCRRTLGHSASPVTADGWMNLAEQIEMAVRPTRAGPTLVQRRGRR